MTAAACHAPVEDARQRCRDLVLKRLGVRRVGDWCGVKDATVYQWLSRGTSEEPFPAKHVPAVVAGARKAGLVFDPVELWPAYAGMTDPQP